MESHTSPCLPTSIITQVVNSSGDQQQHVVHDVNNVSTSNTTTVTIPTTAEYCGKNQTTQGNNLHHRKMLHLFSSFMLGASGLLLLLY